MRIDLGDTENRFKGYSEEKIFLEKVAFF